MTCVRLGDEWRRVGGTRIRGYVYGDGVDSLERAAASLEGSGNPEEWRRGVANLSGCFSVVSERADGVLAAVDRVRSIPLFYAQIGSELYLSDNAYLVRDAGTSKLTDDLSAMEFLLTGYVTGKNTLCDHVKQLQAGESLYFDPRCQSLRCFRYHRFCHDDFLPGDNDELIRHLETVHDNTFRRLVDSLEGRPVVIPLSGGNDSRLIAVSLRDLDVRDVVCYTYGVPGNWEAEISKELAAHLGYRWHFIPYSHRGWTALAASELFQEYLTASGNLTSVPHIQDWPAVQDLKRRRHIDPESVFVPGHTGDFLTGGHTPKWFINCKKITRRQLLDSIYSAHYVLWDWAADERKWKKLLDDKIQEIVGPVDDCTSEQAANLFDRWELQERQAKFICNSLRVYEFFGYEWRLPLYDYELMDFWARIPLVRRQKRKLFFEFMIKQHPLPISEPNADRGQLVNRVVQLLEKGRLLPMAKRTRRFLRRTFWKREYYGHMTAWYGMLRPDYFKRTYTGKEVMHSYIARYYLQSLSGQTSEHEMFRNHDPQ